MRKPVLAFVVLFGVDYFRKRRSPRLCLGPLRSSKPQPANSPARCFPNVAPIGVANFIGLSNGTKDWTSPVTHQKKHGVPLYDGTIFHSVIPELHDPGRRPGGQRHRRSRLSIQERDFILT